MNLPVSEPVIGYGFTNAFPGVVFDRPVVIAAAPGDTNRLFVAEKSGRVMVINNLTKPEASVFLDLRSSTFTSMEAGLLGLAFHPDFARNGRFFVYRVVDFNGFRDQLSEFRCDPPQALASSPASEKVIISQRDLSDTHNAGDLKFGPDGYLYLSVGDEGPVFPDTHDSPQAIDKGLFGGIIRIDVDLRPENLAPNPHASVTANYRIPRDNPFVGLTQFNGSAVDPAKVRTEFFAVGMRNPWRFNFDPFTGQLICAEVGAASIEEINVVEKGGNYGWPYMEGTNTVILDDLPAGLRSPTYWYRHGVGRFEGNVVIGGLVYNGGEFPDLQGKYLFSDYSSGNVWAIDLHAPSPQPVWLAGRAGTSTFARHPADGAVLVANHLNGKIERMAYTRPEDSPLPRTLREVNAFENVATLKPLSNVVPFEVISPLWSDGAIKQRWVDLSRAAGKVTFKEADAWQFPEGMVWLKHFDLELTNGVAASRRRVETRLLVKTADDVYGLTYRWGASQTNASLVPPEGATESFPITDGNTIRTQVWNYPSWDQCRVCHNKEVGFVLGFRTHQLNRPVTIGARETNQIAWLAAQSIFRAGAEINPKNLANLAALDDPFAPHEYRVRSYLESNCMQCHLPGGRSGALWDARTSTPLASAYLVNHAPVFYPAPAKLIDPGHPTNSYLRGRVATRVPLFQMPPLATTEPDAKFLDTLTRWIERIPGADWTTANFGSFRAEGAAELDGDTLRVSSAAAGIDQDAFFFTGRPAFGSTEVSARLAVLAGGAGNAEAGLMLRQDSDVAAPAAALTRQGEKLLFKAKRASATHFDTVATAAVPSGGRLKLVADGERVSAWASDDGTNWRPIGVVDLKLTGSYLAGCAVSSGADAVQFATSDFNDFRLSSIAITNPAATQFMLPVTVPLAASISLFGTAAPAVTFRGNGMDLAKLTNAPWTASWTNAVQGNANISAVLATSSLVLTSPPVGIQLSAPLSEVWLKPVDLRTLGNWNLSYGSEAVFIPGVTNIDSSTVAFSVLHGTARVVGEATNQSALLIQTSRVASELIDPNYISVAFSSLDYGVHQGALYFRDWSNAGRTQTVSFFDRRSQRLLASAKIVAIRGVYLPFAFKDSIEVRITNDTGQSYLTGVFVDPVWPLEVELTSPQDSSILQQPAPVELTVTATAPGREVQRIELWDNDRNIGTFYDASFQLVLTNLFSGEHEIKAVGYGTYDIAGESDIVAVSILPAETRAEFAGIDEGTRGSWTGRYGTAGYWLIGEDKWLPEAVEMSSDGLPYSWVESTTDPSALERLNNDAARFARCLYGQDFLLNLDIRDGQERTVALYLLDWGGSQRDMEVRVEDPAGVVLDRQRVNEFASGKYYRWRVTGQPRFRFISKSINAVFSAAFVDPNVTPYETWLRERFDPSEYRGDSSTISVLDSDGDGLNNALEYFLGSDPKSAADKPYFGFSYSGGWFQVAFTQRTEPVDMSITFEISTDLIHWTAVTPVAISQGTSDGTRRSYNFPAQGNAQFIRYSTRAR